MSASNRGECMHAGKELGFWMCTALVVGNTIGIGIFVLPASILMISAALRMLELGGKEGKEEDGAH